MYIVHHLNNSRSERIVWLLELVSADYQIKAYKRNAKTSLAPRELQQIHALGRSPVLQDGERIVAESGTIAEYILQQTPNEALLPATDHKDYIDIQYWAHFSEGSFMPSLVANMVLRKAKQKSKPIIIKQIANKVIDAIVDAYFGPNMQQNLNYVEDHLKAKSYFVGDQLSLADVHMSFPLHALYKAEMLGNYPNMQAYVKRIMDLPSFQQASSKIAQAESELSSD